MEFKQISLRHKHIHNHGLPLKPCHRVLDAKDGHYHPGMQRKIDSVPFVDDYLAALLAQASTLISQEFHLIVKRSGFSVPEWRVLATLTDKPGMSIGQLAQVSVTKQPTVTRLLDRMVEKGLVERSAHDGDRRMTVVLITPSGRKIINDLVLQAKAHESRVLEPFGHERAEALKNTLREIILLHAHPGSTAID